MNIAVLVTCHNRSDITQRGLLALSLALSEVDNIRFHVFVVDDGSTDNTAETIKNSLSNVSVISGNGNLFWNRGMLTAYQAATERNEKFSHYLLFNDDVLVNKESIVSFFKEVLLIGVDNNILVGSTLDSDGNISYSAYLRNKTCRPLSLVKLPFTGHLQACHTFNGNFVLIPADVMHSLNSLDPIFHHGYGDIDLGLRATNHGISIYLASIPIGTCDSNPPPPVLTSRGQRLHRKLLGTWPKKDSLRQRLHFSRRHTSTLCFLIYAPYIAIRFGVASLTKKLSDH